MRMGSPEITRGVNAVAGIFSGCAQGAQPALIDGAVGVEPRQMVAIGRGEDTIGPQLGEIAADQNLAVGLQRDGVDHVIGARVEAVVEGAIAPGPRVTRNSDLDLA